MAPTHRSHFRCLLSGPMGLLLVGLLLFATPKSSQAAPTFAQRREASALRTLAARVNNFHRAGKLRESAAALKELLARGEKLAEAAGRDAPALLGPIYKSVGAVHTDFQLRGLRLPPLKLADESAPGDKPSTPGAAPAGDKLSFVKHVAPILVGKCGRCHVDDSKGRFSMATFAALMRGSEAGLVIRPGEASGSRLIQVIEEGDMPRGGGKITPAELKTLKTWIDQGARYDNPNRQANLASLAPAARPAAAPKVEVEQATGNETVSFSRELAPVLADKCMNCHGNERPRNRFSVASFARLLRGGDSGPPVLPGKPAESLLIKKFKGTGGGDRMPQRQPPLADDVIARFETWIKEGARFDGPDPDQDTTQVAALAKAKAATHEELSAERTKLAEKNWRLGMPGSESKQVETKNFFVIGNVDEAKLKEIGELAEAQAKKLAPILGAPTDKPLVKGRITLFVFDRPYSYSEFGQMVERRQTPRGVRGHWRYSIVDAYGAVIPPKTGGDELAPLIAQQIAGVYAASLGRDTPRWFAEGVARAATARLAPDDPRVKRWEERLGGVKASMAKADDFLTGKLPQEEADIASYGFVKFLMTTGSRFTKFLERLRAGGKFETTFVASFGGSPAQGAAYWAKK